ncbi:hypothetical protein [Haloterrigena alkaliphila]|uniref:Uncharacterized protein n=1 Tax=Haloterrigena alkaliphila TaxID=2816475 RepID=A0A8A2VIY2_9EURY|nr:hypothetical protein [Haloterrigena alkaliphila]QSX00345.1 hypothetical protein J0X25_05100 [Haloterrigena alkaliphila]
MTFLPLAGVVVLAAIALAIAGGLVAELAVFFAAFLAIQTLAAAVALSVGGNDRRLLLHAPLLVVGFKQLLDAIAVKALIDVARGVSVRWTSAERADHRSSAGDQESPSTAASASSSSRSASTPWRS